MAGAGSGGRVAITRSPCPTSRSASLTTPSASSPRLLDFYGIDWDYEPRTFTLERDKDGNPVQAFTPDFYLPAYDLYIEITTLNQKLVTKKNRKARRLKELHPEVNIRVFYQRDYLSLLMKYGLEPPSQLVGEADAPPFWLADPKAAPPSEPDIVPAEPEGEGREPRRRRPKSA